METLGGMNVRLFAGFQGSNFFFFFSIFGHSPILRKLKDDEPEIPLEYPPVVDALLSM